MEDRESSAGDAVHGTELTDVHQLPGGGRERLKKAGAQDFALTQSRDLSLGILHASMCPSCWAGGRESLEVFLFLQKIPSSRFTQSRMKSV